MQRAACSCQYSRINKPMQVMLRKRRHKLRSSTAGMVTLAEPACRVSWRHCQMVALTCRVWCSAKVRRGRARDLPSLLSSWKAAPSCLVQGAALLLARRV